MSLKEDNMNEDRRIIYQQDCESLRYQDKLFWSRFQTLVAIEGAALGVILTKTIEGHPAIILAFGNLLLVVLISLLALKDRTHSKDFLARMRKYEENKVDEIKSKVLPINGFIFTVIVSVLLLALNIYLIIFAFRGSG